MLKTWYEEAVGCQQAAHLLYEEGTAVIYKGFKISNISGTDIYNILDVRSSEFYSKVSKSDMDILSSHGFIKGCDLILLQRDQNRVNSYVKRLERLHKNKYEYIKNKDTKRLRICSKKILEYIDLLFFYKSRLNQLKSKYNEA